VRRSETDDTPSWFVWSSTS